MRSAVLVGPGGKGCRGGEGEEGEEQGGQGFGEHLEVLWIYGDRRGCIVIVEELINLYQKLLNVEKNVSGADTRYEIRTPYVSRRTNWWEVEAVVSGAMVDFRRCCENMDGHYLSRQSQHGYDTAYYRDHKRVTRPGDMLEVTWWRSTWWLA